MIGLVLALIVTSIILSLLGVWIFGIPVFIVGLILFLIFIVGFGRRAAADKP